MFDVLTKPDILVSVCLYKKKAVTKALLEDHYFKVSVHKILYYYLKNGYVHF